MPVSHTCAASICHTPFSSLVIIISVLHFTLVCHTMTRTITRSRLDWSVKVPHVDDGLFSADFVAKRRASDGVDA